MYKTKLSPHPEQVCKNNQSIYINRELSWLAFNERVLEEASDPMNPLFERLKFLSITSSNLDEFFMVRVANLKDQIREGINLPDNKSGLTPIQQLEAIRMRVKELVSRQYEELNTRIFPELEKEGFYFVRGTSMKAEHRKYAEKLFDEQIFPVLTPIGIDPSHPFPRLLNKSLNLVLQLERITDKKNNRLIAVVQVPSLLSRFIKLPSENGNVTFTFLEDIIETYIERLFLGYQVISVDFFRITRNADLTLNEEGVDDLLEEIEEELKGRGLGAEVRLEINETMCHSVRAFLIESLEIDEEDLYEIEGPLDLTFLSDFYSIEGFDHLRYEKLVPQTSEDLREEEDIFQAISRNDILLHHPYQSFEPVIQLIQKAAEDPSVLAIKQTLYRVSGNSPIIQALMKAAANGKQVFVLVELKARFDEENNIAWARKLEDAGCHVIYGIIGLKTHSKIILVVRREGSEIKRYVHLGTGNYNDKTAKLYTDLGLFTKNEEIGGDASLFFNYLSGYTNPPSLKQLVMAPNQLKKKFLSLIHNEISKSTADEPGRIVAKINALTDKDVIQALFAASQAGVKIDLIIRGICCLQTGIEGISENIRVISIVGRFLEHSRIYYFRNGGDEQLFLSSSDWMTRNLEKRVELLFPIIDDRLKERVKETLQAMLKDNEKARELQKDGTYQVKVKDQDPFESQHYFVQLAAKDEEDSY